MLHHGSAMAVDGYALEPPASRSHSRCQASLPLWSLPYPAAPALTQAALTSLSRGLPSGRLLAAARSASRKLSAECASGRWDEGGGEGGGRSDIVKEWAACRRGRERGGDTQCTTAGMA